MYFSMTKPLVELVVEHRTPHTRWRMNCGDLKNGNLKQNCLQFQSSIFFIRKHLILQQKNKIKKIYGK